MGRILILTSQEQCQEVLQGWPLLVKSPAQLWVLAALSFGGRIELLELESHYNFIMNQAPFTARKEERIITAFQYIINVSHCFPDEF